MSEQDDASDRDYFERKADRGKPRMSLVPWEFWYRLHGPLKSPDLLIAALRSFQEEDGLELENLLHYVVRYVDPEAVASVLAFGAEKYDENSWRDVPDAVRRYRDALWRHQDAIRRGELTDPESGLPHSAHRDCCAVFLFALLHKERDL